MGLQKSAVHLSVGLSEGDVLVEKLQDYVNK